MPKVLSPNGAKPALHPQSREKCLETNRKPPLSAARANTRQSPRSFGVGRAGNREGAVKFGVQRVFRAFDWVDILVGASGSRARYASRKLDVRQEPEFPALGRGEVQESV